MRKILMACFIYSAIVSINAYAEDKDSLHDCDENLQTMTSCARETYDLSDKELNIAYKKHLSSLLNSKEKRVFRNEQRAWIKSRDQGCQNEVPVRDGSRTDWQLDYWKCMTLYTQERTNQIQ
jgi:uncharacterized protein YecT (DUF1311 family)